MKRGACESAVHLERAVRREPHRRVGTLSCRLRAMMPSVEARCTRNRRRQTHNRAKPAVDARDALLLDDLHRAVHQAAIPRHLALLVVDQLRPTRMSQSPGGSEKMGRTHLIVSDGVTAKTASIMPAPSPAARSGESAAKSRY